MFGEHAKYMDRTSEAEMHTLSALYDVSWIENGLLMNDKSNGAGSASLEDLMEDDDSFSRADDNGSFSNTPKDSINQTASQTDSPKKNSKGSAAQSSETLFCPSNSCSRSAEASDGANVCHLQVQRILGDSSTLMVTRRTTNRSLFYLCSLDPTPAWMLAEWSAEGHSLLQLVSQLHRDAASARYLLGDPIQRDYCYPEYDPRHWLRSIRKDQHSY